VAVTSMANSSIRDFTKFNRMSTTFGAPPFACEYVVIAGGGGGGNGQVVAGRQSGGGGGAGGYRTNAGTSGGGRLPRIHCLFWREFTQLLWVRPALAQLLPVVLVARAIVVFLAQLVLSEVVPVAVMTIMVGLVVLAVVVALSH